MSDVTVGRYGDDVGDKGDGVIHDQNPYVSPAFAEYATRPEPRSLRVPSTRFRWRRLVLCIVAHELTATGAAIATELAAQPREGVGHIGLLGLWFVQTTAGCFVSLVLIALIVLASRLLLDTSEVVLWLASVGGVVVFLLGSVGFTILSMQDGVDMSWFKLIAATSLVAGPYTAAMVTFDLQHALFDQQGFSSG